MAFNSLEYLECGNVDFVHRATLYDKDTMIHNIRKSQNKNKIINGFLNKLKDSEVSFCIKIIYDMEEYKDIALELLKKAGNYFLKHEEVNNILCKTSWGKEYVINNFYELIDNDEKTIEIIIKYALDNYDKDASFVKFLSLHKDLHIRYLFMEYLVTNYPNLINAVYDDITKYLTSYTHQEFEQLTFFPQLMNNKDISDLAIKCIFLDDKTTWLKLKEYILNNYNSNDLAQKLLSFSNSKEKNILLESEFKKDSERLFKTSRNFKFSIYRSFSRDVSQKLLEDFYNKIKIFDYNGKIKENWKLSSIYFYGLGDILEKCVDKYLSLSKDQSYSYITSGSMSACYRIGDYAFKLCTHKWSYEDVICPDLYLILKNLEEYFVRDDKGIIQAGLEIQKFLTKEAKNIEPKYFNMFQKELSRLGYYVNDSLINGPCGDNCMLLDSYKDADCSNTELLPDWFKEYPIVLIDRDRIYEKGNTFIKQLNQRY